MFIFNSNKQLKSFFIIAIILFSVLVLPESSFARRQASQEQLNATGQLQVDKIKEVCKRENPNNDTMYRDCATLRYNSMRLFYTKLFQQRDTKGAQSSEFKKGIDCIFKASPSVNEPNRKKAVELADWIMANKCYEEALK